MLAAHLTAALLVGVIVLVLVPMDVQILVQVVRELVLLNVQLLVQAVREHVHLNVLAVVQVIVLVVALALFKVQQVIIVEDMAQVQEQGVEEIVQANVPVIVPHHVLELVL